MEFFDEKMMAWRWAFMSEWFRLARTRVDVQELARLASDVYFERKDQDPAMAAREVRAERRAE